MIRIVGLQRSDDPRQEFVLLQNHGSMRVNLRGHALVSDAWLDTFDGPATAVIIRDDIEIPPGQYAIVRTCSGTGRWDYRQEGYHTYYAHLGSPESVWKDHYGKIHLLAPQHSYSARSAELLLV